MKATREAEAKVEAPKTARASKATAAKAGKGEKPRRNNQNFQRKGNPPRSIHPASAKSNCLKVSP